MKYEILGNDLPFVQFELEAGESLITQTGGMSWMSSTMKMETNFKGGLTGTFARLLTGESLTLTTYTAMSNHQKIAFSTTFAGSIIPLTLNGEVEWMAQKSAFLVSTPEVQLSTAWTQRVSAGLFGGEGFILQRLSGEGVVFLEASGTVMRKELGEGEVLYVDTGNLVAFSETVEFDIETIKGFKNVFLGGEGVFLTRLTGPGVVLLQSHTLSDLAFALMPFFPLSQS